MPTLQYFRNCSFVFLSNTGQESLHALLWNVFTLEVKDKSEDLSDSAAEDLILLECAIEVSPFEFGVIAEEHLEDFVQ